MNIKRYFHLKRSRAPAFSSEHVSMWERLGEDAYVGWVVIVFISLLMAAILIALAGRLFFLVESGSITSPQAAVSSASRADFDQNALDGVIASFDAKASTTSADLKGYEGPPDPSQ